MKYYVQVNYQRVLKIEKDVEPTSEEFQDLVENAFDQELEYVDAYVTDESGDTIYENWSMIIIGIIIFLVVSELFE